MKKNLLSLLCVSLMFISTSFANDATEPSSATKSEFNRTFTQAANVQWKKISGIYEASFIQSGIYLTAFFGIDNRIEYVSRNVSIDNLPLLIQKNLTSLMKNAWVTECFELVGKTCTQYYAIIEDADTKTLYRTDGNDWYADKATKK